MQNFWTKEWKSFVSHLIIHIYYLWLEPVHKKKSSFLVVGYLWDLLEGIKAGSYSLCPSSQFFFNLLSSWSSSSFLSFLDSVSSFHNFGLYLLVEYIYLLFVHYMLFCPFHSDWINLFFI